MSLLLALLLAAAPVKPVVIHERGMYLVPEQAWNALDAELKRLQTIEALHKEESWELVVLMGASIGAALTFVVWGICAANPVRP